MKTALLFFFAFLLSAFGGSLVVQIAAEMARGDMEYILAFMAIPFFALVAVVVLALCYGLGSGPRPLDLAALIMAGIVIALCAAAIGLDVKTMGSAQAMRKTLPLLGSMALGGCLTIAIQWWLIRRRFLRRAAQVA
ncbi:MAG: hypothetical protein J0H01_20300 [Rhizobiales bacterium]|nr:hypothetical protein [Hyphomicrobiales bacterium]